MISDVGLRRPVVEGAGPQRPPGPVGADDDSRGRSLRADEREFARRAPFEKKRLPVSNRTGYPIAIISALLYQSPALHPA